MNSEKSAPFSWLLTEQNWSKAMCRRHLRDRADSMEGWDTSHSVQQQRGLKHRERAPSWWNSWERPWRRELMTWRVLWELHSQCMGSVGLWSTKKRTSWTWTKTIVNSCCFWTEKTVGTQCTVNPLLHTPIAPSHHLVWIPSVCPIACFRILNAEAFDANKSWASDHLWPRLLTATRWSETYQNLHLTGTHRKQLHMWTSLSLPIRSAMHQEQKT